MHLKETLDSTRKLRWTRGWDHFNLKWGSSSSSQNPKTAHGTTQQCMTKQKSHVSVTHTRWTTRTTGRRKREKEGDLRTQTTSDKNTQQCVRSPKHQHSPEMQNHFPSKFSASLLSSSRGRTMLSYHFVTVQLPPVSFRGVTAPFFSLVSSSLLHKIHNSGCSTLQRAEFYSHLSNSSNSLGFVFTRMIILATKNLHFKRHVSSMTHSTCVN